MIILIAFLLFAGVVVAAGNFNDYLKGAPLWHALAGMLASFVIVCMALYLYSVTYPNL